MIKKKFFVLLGLAELLYLSFYGLKALSLRLGVENLFFKDNRIFGLFILIFIALFFLYKSTLKLVTEETSFKTLFICSIVINFSFLFIWNLSTDDFYTYIFRFRLLPKYGANPYLVPYDAFPNDAFYSLIKTYWSRETTIHGPVFMLFGSLLSYLGGDSLFRNIYLFKLVFIALNISSGYLIYKITASVKSFFLYAFNPLVLFELSLNGHFDVLMIAILLGGLYLIAKRKTWLNQALGTILLFVSILTKYMILIVVPLYSLLALRKVAGVKDRIWFIITIMVGSLLVSVLALYPFEERFEIFDRVSRIARARLLGPSLGISLVERILNFIFGGDNHWVARNINKSIFSAGYIFLGLKALLARNLSFGRITFYAVVAYGLFFLTSLSLVQPWYVTSLITLFCVGIGFTKKLNPNHIYLVTIYGFLTYFVMR